MAFLLILVETPFQLLAQTISAEQVFPVKGYSVFEVGHPLKLLAGPGAQFHFLEYWVGGEQGRTVSNHYLQTYNSYDYGEIGFVPVTPPQSPFMQIKDMLPMNDFGVAIIGDQEIGEDGVEHTVANFFDKARNRYHEETIQLSCQEGRRRRNYKEWLVPSPKGKFLLWVGINGKESFAALYDHTGKNEWQSSFELPYAKEDYILVDVAVDDYGRPFLLMRSEDDEPGLPLYLLRYLPVMYDYEEEIIQLEENSLALQAKLSLISDSLVLVTGVTQNMQDSLGLTNGNMLKEEEIWTDFFVARYRLEEETNLKQSYVSYSPVPDSWMKRYNGREDKGSNFNNFKVMAHRGTLLLILEEQYRRRDTWYYYDLGVQAFNLSNGQLRWEKIIPKKQRDRGTDVVLSYVPGIYRNKLNLVFLTERGARGKLNCTTLSLSNGERKDRYLASNETAEYLFFPARSGMVNDREMVLIGLGSPGKNDYKLVTITF